MREIRYIVVSAIAVGLLAGSGLSVAAQEEAPPPVLPVEFTGTIVCGTEVRAANTDKWDVALSDGGQMTRSRSDGYVERQDATVSDPRLEGDHYLSVNSNDYVVGESGVSLANLTRRIENELGAWQGSFTSAFLSDGTGTAGATVLAGEGAYEGLSAIWEEHFTGATCSAAVRGVIFEGDPPPTANAHIGE